jgi:hypothetical protein
MRHVYQSTSRKKTLRTNMLPPQTKPEKILLVSLLSALQDSISQVVIREIFSLKALIECSSKDIDLRLVNLEDRLQIAVGPHCQQMTQNSIENRVEMQKRTKINVEEDHEKSPGIDFKPKLSDKTIGLEEKKEQVQASNVVHPPNATASLQFLNEVVPANESQGSSLTIAQEIEPRNMPLLDVASTTKQISLVRVKTIVAGALQDNDSTVIYDRHDVARKVPTCFRGCKSILWVDTAIQAALKSVFGISDPNIWVGHPGSSVIHPGSPFSTGVLRPSARSPARSRPCTVAACLAPGSLRGSPPPYPPPHLNPAAPTILAQASNRWRPPCSSTAWGSSRSSSPSGARELSPTQPDSPTTTTTTTTTSPPPPPPPARPPAPPAPVLPARATGGPEGRSVACSSGPVRLGQAGGPSRGRASERERAR